MNTQVVRDNAGHFQPGTPSPNPNGRPPKSKERAVLDAIKSTLPPERVSALVEEALTLARASGSWRGIMSVLQWQADYCVGKPVQRIESGKSSDDLLALLLSNTAPLIPVDIEQQLLTGRDPVALPG